MLDKPETNRLILIVLTHRITERLDMMIISRYTVGLYDNTNYNCIYAITQCVMTVEVLGYTCTCISNMTLNRPTDQGITKMQLMNEMES